MTHHEYDWAARLTPSFPGERPSASIEVRLACWLDRVRRLILARDTPRDGAPHAPEAGAGGPSPPVGDADAGSSP